MLVAVLPIEREFDERMYFAKAFAAPSAHFGHAAAMTFADADEQLLAPLPLVMV